MAPGWVESIGRLTDGGMVLYDGPSASCNQQTAVLFAGALHRVDQVLGSCWTARDIADGHMFVTDPSGASSEFTPLAGNIYITPGAINAAGEVVGQSSGNAASRPFLIRHRRLIELTTLVPGLTMWPVSGLNNRGHILAGGTSNGQLRAVLLKPADRPQGLRASAAANQVTLTWSPPAGAPAGVTYLLQVGSSPGASNVFNANIGGGTTIGGAVPNGAYVARLTMRYPDGAFGGASEELSFSVPMPPAAPTGLTASVSGLTDLYNGSIGTTPGITTAVAPATYHIRIRARNAGGVSPPSNEVMVVVP